MEIFQKGKVKMIRMFYDRACKNVFIMFCATKIENRDVEGTYYIERDFKKIFPSCNPYYFRLNIFEYKNLDLKQFKASMV